jgi:hypothetical protein
MHPHAEQTHKGLRTIEEHNQAVLALKSKFCGSRRRLMTGIACPKCGEEMAEVTPPVRVPATPAMMKIECPCGHTTTVFTV